MLPTLLVAQVKAWCYYESRLLGAHHGLISSYALETMVLYVINIYHRQLASPFDVSCCDAAPAAAGRQAGRQASGQLTGWAALRPASSGQTTFARLSGLSLT